MQHNKLKIGLFLDNELVSAWKYHAIERLLKSDFCEFVLSIFCADKSVASNNNSIAYHWFDRLDRFIFHPKPDAFAKKNIRTLINSYPQLTIKPISKDEFISFNVEDLANIRAAKVDIFIKFGFGVLHKSIDKFSKYGVWCIFHSDESELKAGHAGFGKYSDHTRETKASLNILSTEEGPELTLENTSYRTNPYSPTLNRHHYYWQSSFFLFRQIQKLYQLGEQVFFYMHKKKQQPIETDTTRLLVSADNVQCLYLLTCFIKRLAYRVFQRLFYQDHWFLLYQLGSTDKLLIEEFKVMMPPKNKLWADPHLVFENNRYYIFLEELEYVNNKGYLSVIEMDLKGNYKAPVKIIETPQHLSYPFIFKVEGNYYMIPESQENKQIDLYQCRSFPYQWEFKKTLMKNVRAADSTLIFYNKKWWLFTAIAVSSEFTEYNEYSFDSELFLFYADDFCTDQWQAHPLNPIVSDVKNARPAGKLFYKNNKLYRPAQDCSVIYGYATNFNEISILSETDYKEESISSITPDWHESIKGTHTYSQEGELTIIDAFHYRSKYFF
ncbi:MAG: hypothetical protein QM479_13690 [Pseudomonadota bacterium]